MVSGCPGSTEKLPPGRKPLSTHPLKRLGKCVGTRKRQSSDDGPTGKQFRVRSQHDRGHRPAGRQARNEDPRAIEPLFACDVLDHLADRRCFAPTAASIPWQVPVETEVGMICPALLGKEHRKPVSLGELGPAAALVISRSALRAAVKHDNQGARHVVGHIDARIEIARIAAKPTQSIEPAIIVRVRCLHYSASRG